jgi:hypothetical protein
VDPQLRLQCAEVISIATPATLDIAGQILTGTPFTAFARTEQRYREVTVNGVLEKTTHFVILDATTGASVTQSSMRNVQIWLPGDSSSDVTLARRPKTVHYCVDEYGALDHVELFI